MLELEFEQFGQKDKSNKIKQTLYNINLSCSLVQFAWQSNCVCPSLNKD